MMMKKEMTTTTIKTGIMIHPIRQTKKEAIPIGSKTKQVKNKMVKKVNLVHSLSLNSLLIMYFSSLNGVISKVKFVNFFKLGRR